MRKGLVLAMLCVNMLLAAGVSAQTADKAYEAALEDVLKLSGQTTSVEAMLPQVIAVYKQMSPTVPAAFWDAFQKKWVEKFNGKLAEVYTPIYQKYLTLADLKEIAAFYESPVGRKLGAFTPAMMMEGMQAGQKLGAEIAVDLLKELQTQEARKSE